MEMAKLTNTKSVKNCQQILEINNSVLLVGNPYSCCGQSIRVSPMMHALRPEGISNSTLVIGH